MRIVITDSGLGGLSVLAELEKRLNEHPIFKNSELIFFNSLYSSEYGYNLIKKFSDKVNIFNNALYSMERNFNPDLILIACNTLSVVYPHTKFSQTSDTEVKGILDSGLALFRDQIQSKDDKIILFGTPTTIDSNIYRAGLLDREVNSSQIVDRSCPDLESEIQRDPNSDKTIRSISKFVQEALDNIDSAGNKLFAGLCCTHYGYSEKIFFDELSKKYNGEVKILNPNSTMLDFLFDASSKTFRNSNITIRVVTQVKVRENEKKLLSNIFIDGSPKTAAALLEYEYVEDLFEK